ncbi:MAG: taurine dioxygenase [Gammaproteobacteria bacterium]|jgi:taurine dioxygenase
MDYQTIDVTPIGPAIGAEIHGLDLSQALSQTTVTEIRAALLEHLVIFIRDQDITPAEHLAFARYFGELSIYPFVRGLSDYPAIVEVRKEPSESANFGGLWHTDTSYLEVPPLGSILYAKEVPPSGGDTLFANMYLAYDALSQGMKAALENLRAVNSAQRGTAAAGRVERIRDNPTDNAKVVTTASHPLVRTHPETGRKGLYCSDAHTMTIEGLSEEESAPLLQYLYQVQQRPEFSCRFRWEQGSLAFWDNRAAQHNALNDYEGHRRIMHRVTLAGDLPR